MRSMLVRDSPDVSQPIMDALFVSRQSEHWGCHWVPYCKVDEKETFKLYLIEEMWLGFLYQDQSRNVAYSLSPQDIQLITAVSPDYI